MIEFITNYLINRKMKSNPKRLIKQLIRKHLPDHHLSSNPIRKSKKSEGQAVM
jgi:hypothetical protein